MILFTADIHIKLGQKGVPRDWALSRYQKLFEDLAEASNGVDLMIVGGDIFDRMPTLEEVRLYFSFVKSCRVPTLIYPGNHEATKKGKTFLSAVEEITNLVNSNVTVVTEVLETEDYTILPYCELHRKGVFEELNKDKPLFTHVRGEIPPHVKPEIDLSLLDKFPIVFAGDLHSHSNTQRNIIYPGSPITTTFHRSEVDTGYLIINDDFTWSWNQLDMPQLIRKTVQDPSEMVPTDYHHTIYELEGDLAELADVKNSDLLDKKVVKRNTEASLILDNSMSLTDELSEYLLYILELPESTVEELLGVFNDSITETQME